MTLYRQLLATMLILFGLLFAATYWVQFNSTRTYLAQQQETTVINTATSLGLALTPYLENGDKVGLSPSFRRYLMGILSSGPSGLAGFQGCHRAGKYQ